MPTLFETFIAPLIRETYRQGWDDCMGRFSVKPVVADLKFMAREQERQVDTILFKLRYENVFPEMK